TGESFDYGPYRFLPHYEPGFTAAYFDHSGLYAYGRQPGTLLWNLQRLAECLRLVADEEPLVAALQTFPQVFETELARAMFRRVKRLGISWSHNHRHRGARDGSASRGPGHPGPSGQARG